MDRHNRARSFPSELPNLYDIFLCEVANIQQYGIFVKIPGFKKNGLVHKSQMSKSKVDDPSDMVEPHEHVYCKVISIDKDSEKIGMSMKVVNQTTGQDLDPGHVQTSLDEQRRKTGHVKEIPRIELGAVLDTTCKKCGGKGHLAHDCFHVSGGKSYSLLPDLDYLAQQKVKSHKHKQKKNKEKLSKKEKKAKKKAKKKKSRKSKRTRSQSTEDEENGVKQNRKRKRKESTSYSSSSETSADEPSVKRSHHQRDERTPSHRHHCDTARRSHSNEDDHSIRESAVRHHQEREDMKDSTQRKRGEQREPIKSRD